MAVMTKRERAAEVMRMALSETVPGFDPDSVYVIDHSNKRATIAVPDNVDLTLLNRARLLGQMAGFGPDATTECDSHSLISRPSAWQRCGRVTVRDALVGRTCEVTP